MSLKRLLLALTFTVTLANSAFLVWFASKSQDSMAICADQIVERANAKAVDSHDMRVLFDGAGCGSVVASRMRARAVVDAIR